MEEEGRIVSITQRDLDEFAEKQRGEIREAITASLRQHLVPLSDVIRKQGEQLEVLRSDVENLSKHAGADKPKVEIHSVEQNYTNMATCTGTPAAKIDSDIQHEKLSTWLHAYSCIPCAIHRHIG